MAVGDKKRVLMEADKAAAGGVATLDASGKLAQMPTAADVGAAPAGFGGYGEALALVRGTDAELFAALDAKLALLPDGIAMRIALASSETLGDYQYDGVLEKFSSSLAVFKGITYGAYPSSGKPREPVEIVISKTNANWIIEFVNPPMQPNREYRTTERIAGKAVYKRNNGGVIEYRLDGEETWKPYAQAVGGLATDGSNAMTGDSLGLRSGVGSVSATDTYTEVNSNPSANENNRTTLRVWNNAEIKSALNLRRYSNGVVLNNVTVLHTGNKPSGSYTGNGDGAVRTIETGGVANCVLLWSEAYGAAFVHENGAIHISKTGVMTLYARGYIRIEAGGNLRCATANDAFNANGATYNYLYL